MRILRATLTDLVAKVGRNLQLYAAWETASCKQLKYLGWGASVEPWSCEFTACSAPCMAHLHLQVAWTV